ncbi:MAG: hypothetical protein VW872_03805, partial [Candidatus Poseidoniales archaeon]
FNLTHPEAVEVETPITIQAVDIEDIDTSSPSGQQVTITWPGLECNEGITQATCTFTPMFEGPINITAVATDDDGDTTIIFSEVTVLNIPPTISAPTLTKGGQEVQPDENGTWHINEDEVGVLKATASDSENDEGTVIVQWFPSLADENWTITSIGVASQELVAWNTSGEHIVQVRAIDADGATSEVQQATVMVHNVPPTVEGLPGNTPVFEDDALNLSVAASDTASDLETLTICWDLDAKVDSDNDGVNDNDCELTGASVAPSWSTKGVRMITVTVTDDDGATAQQSMNVSVLNLPPREYLNAQVAFTNLTEGDNLTMNGADFFFDSATDSESLGFQWDSSHLDTDLDGTTTGDVDFTGGTWTITDLPAGSWTVVLTATDDDGEQVQKELTIVVAELPADGLIESITSAVGTTTAAIIGLLGIIIVGLVVFLLFTRQRPAADDFSMFEQSQFAAAPKPVASLPPTPATAVPAQAVAAPMEPQPAAAPADPTMVNTGPPLPVTGLPQGWTMEQWNYYGEQWLAANQPAPAPVQPIVSQTPPTPASAELQSLLDDLDF